MIYVTMRLTHSSGFAGCLRLIALFNQMPELNQVLRPSLTKSLLIYISGAIKTAVDTQAEKLCL